MDNTDCLVDWLICFVYSPFHCHYQLQSWEGNHIKQHFVLIWCLLDFKTADIKILDFFSISIAMEAPPGCWAVLSLPDEQGSKVLMAVENNIFELDSFQAKPKVSAEFTCLLQIG